MVQNKDYFIAKWHEKLERDNVLQRYKTKQFIEIISTAVTLSEFDTDLYFTLVDKITVYDGGRLIVSLLDGNEIECELNN